MPDPTFLGPDPPANSEAATILGAPDPFTTSLPTARAVYRGVRETKLVDPFRLEGADPDDGGERWTNATLREPLARALDALHNYCTARGIPWTKRTQYILFGPHQSNIYPSMLGLPDFYVPVAILYRQVEPAKLARIAALNLSVGPNGVPMHGTAQVIPTVAPHPFKTGDPVTFSGIQGLTGFNDLWVCVNDQDELGADIDQPGQFYIHGVPLRAGAGLRYDLSNAWAYSSSTQFSEVSPCGEDALRSLRQFSPTTAPRGWAWHQNRIETTATTGQVQLCLSYYANCSLPESIYEPIGVEGALNFLIAQTAAEAIGGISTGQATLFKQEAMQALDLLQTPEIRQRQLAPIERPYAYPMRRHKF